MSSTVILTLSDEVEFHRLYITAQGIQKYGYSRSAAHRMVAACPSTITVHIKGKRPCRAVPRASFELLRSKRTRRGNPNFKDPGYQRNMAQRRWAKDKP